MNEWKAMDKGWFSYSRETSFEADLAHGLS